MHQYQAMVKAGGLIVHTIVFAENTTAAVKILQALYGVSNVASIPKQVK